MGVGGQKFKKKLLLDPKTLHKHSNYSNAWVKIN